MSAKSPSSNPLIFAWGVRDHSTWHLVIAFLLLMGGMAGFFFIFRIVHPSVQRMPTTPQHVIVLDPKDPAALALMHRAQDRSFALLSDSDESAAEMPGLAFRPSFQDYQIKLRDPAPEPVELRQPRLFTATSDVLPPVPRRATDLAPEPPSAVLKAVMSASLAKRGPATVEIGSQIELTQPTRVQFRVAVGSAGQIITALPLSSADEADVMRQLGDAVAALRFAPAEGRRIEWGEISFRWEAADKP